MSAPSLHRESTDSLIIMSSSLGSLNEGVPIISHPLSSLRKSVTRGEKRKRSQNTNTNRKKNTHNKKKYFYKSPYK